MLTVALGSTGCAARTLAPLDPSQPIETEHGYQQDGRPLDPKSMNEWLEKEPEAGPHVRRAGTLGTISTVLAAAGGALVGWPVGEKIAGSEDPHWGLAYAGGACVVLAIPLVLWSVSSLNQAVQAHNRKVGQPARESALKVRTSTGSLALTW